MHDDEFLFGIEAEFPLADAQTFEPLWQPKLTFEGLNAILESISVGDLPCRGLNIKPLHRTASPYLIEGYYLTDEQYKPKRLLPKGVELRTPTTTNIENCLDMLSLLYERMKEKLNKHGYCPIILSHHPTEDHFEGPPNYERYDYWQWAMEVMTTYGPDVNIGLPPRLAEKIDLKDLEAKLNYYAPCITALTLNAPLLRGDLWNIRGRLGKSVRTYKRSVFAPPLTIHTKPALRFELKCLEMARSIDDYQNYLLIWLTILLDSELKGRATNHSRIYDMGQVARFGLNAEMAHVRAREVLVRAKVLTDAFGFANRTLDIFWDRLETGRVPADDVIDLFQYEQSIPGTLRHLTKLEVSRIREPIPLQPSAVRKFRPGEPFLNSA